MRKRLIPLDYQEDQRFLFVKDEAVYGASLTDESLWSKEQPRGISQSLPRK